MTISERIMLGLTFFAFAFSTFSLGLNAFDMAGYEFPKSILYTLGVIAYISMFAYFILGVSLLKKLTNR